MRSLAQLLEEGWLPDGFSVTSAAVSEMDTAGFRSLIAERLALHAPMVSEEARSGLLRRLGYVPTVVTDGEAVARAVGTAGGESLVAYLALPPGLFPATVESLAREGDGRRDGRGAQRPRRRRPPRAGRGGGRVRQELGPVGRWPAQVG